MIEAKEPGADLREAYREARLYAHELNAVFDRDVNPVALVLAVNGQEVWVGSPNSHEPDARVGTGDLLPHSMGLAKLQEILSENALDSHLSSVKAKSKPSRRYRPKAMLGGPAVTDEAMPRNSFGATLADELRYIFKPESREDRARVAREAYVKSGTRSRYLKPIDAIIRASVPRSHATARLVQDVSKPTEVLSTLAQDRQTLEHQVMLVIGGVGAGKSTFIDHIQEVALDEALRSRTLWVHLNMNLAPSVPNELYEWLRRSMISATRQEHPDIDFSDISTLAALYSVELNAFKKGVGQLYKSDPIVYDQKQAEIIQSCQADSHASAACHFRYLGGEKGKLVIVILDNCDKRTRDEQLLMFQAAQWIKSEFRCLVILPLREETYDHHRDEPPLDTALKDLVFRIEPPDFHNVLVKRVQMALNKISSKHPKGRSLRFNLPNSMHVDYSASDQGRYLASIMASIFVNDRTVSRLIVGLAGRDIRRAFELFLEICNSGHIPESEIVKIRSSKGNHTIPLHVIMRVLLRQNRRFFSSKDAYVKNIVQSEISIDPMLGFGRMLILNWLNERISKLGPSRLPGYFRVSDLVVDLAKLGLEEPIAVREVEYLVSAHCILTEDFKQEIAENTLVKISPAGVVHLDLLDDPNYWAAIAEDSLFEDETVAREISGRLIDAKRQFSEIATALNSHDSVTYFEALRSRLMDQISYLHEADAKVVPDFSAAVGPIEQLAKNSGLEHWLNARDKLTSGSEHVVTLDRQKHYGYFVDFYPGVSGLLFTRDVPEPQRPQLAVGARVKVVIEKVEPLRRKIHLSFASFVE